MRKIVLLLVLFSIMFLMNSCQKPAEIIVTKYFQAMKNLDRDTMTSMAIEPKDLKYESYEIVSISEPVMEPSKLPGLMEELKNVEKRRADQAREALDKKADVEDLQDELELVRRRSKKSELRRQIAEAEKAQEAAEQKYREIIAERGEIKKKIEVQKNLIKLSTSIDEKPELYTGDSERVNVFVKVTLTNKEVNDYVFHLIKFNFEVKERTIPSRLVISKIQTVAEYEKESEVKVEEKDTKTEEVKEEKIEEEK